MSIGKQPISIEGADKQPIARKEGREKDQIANKIIEMNVGGVVYSTTTHTLFQFHGSLFPHLLRQYYCCVNNKNNKSNNNNNTATNEEALNNGDDITTTYKSSAHSPIDSTLSWDAPIVDNHHRLFIDRDGVLFRFVLDFLRNKKIVLPEEFQEIDRLKQEAGYFKLPSLFDQLCTKNAQSSSRVASRNNIFDSQNDNSTSPHNNTSPHNSTSPCTSFSSYLTSPLPTNTFSTTPQPTPGYIVLGYRGTFAFGREGSSLDAKFRKLWRILVCGRVSLCRLVFKEMLNESREVDRGG